MPDYIQIQFQQITTQIVDSFNIMFKTANPEIFFTRRLFGLKKIQELKTLENMYPTYKSNFNASYFEKQYNEKSAFALHHCYNSFIGKVKTNTAIQKRITEFWKIVELHCGHENMINIKTSLDNYNQALHDQYVNKIKEHVNNLSNKFEMNDLEKQFITNLMIKWPVNYPHISLNRLSNGTISVEYTGYLIGKIKLRGKSYSMQIIKGLTNVYDVTGTIEDFINNIDKWIYYFNKYIRKELV